MKIKDIIIFALIIFNIGMVFWLNFSIPKFAYVRSVDLVESYKGMEEGRQLFQTKKNVWQNTVDSLKRNLETQISIYNQTKNDLSKNELIEKEQVLNNLQQSYYEFAKDIEEKASAEDQRITQSVLNQINSFTEQYGKENGYTMILGTTMDGA
ncbi:MAG: hypothetical protein A2046_07680, partial [Bacteroidetes bacterium GWA2_30_7]